MYHLLDSVTHGRSQLDLFTDRDRQILSFTKALSQDPPPEEVFFLEGGAGNGKSLLLWFLEKHCCKRFSDWEGQIKNLDPAQRRDLLLETTKAKDSGVEFQSVPAIRHDFAAQPIQYAQPKVAYDALEMLRCSLNASGFRFPIFTFASIWYLKKKHMLTQGRLQSFGGKSGLVQAIVDLITGGVDAVTMGQGGNIASALFSLFDEHLEERWMLWKTRFGVDGGTVSDIMEMDPDRELYYKLPYYFAQDLNVAMEGEDVADRLVLFFDHYDAFFHEDKTQSGSPGSGAPDSWVAILLNELVMRHA